MNKKIDRENILSINRKLLEKAKINRDEFWSFLKNYNVISLAVAVVIGSAAKELVTALVNDLVMPTIGILTPSGQWRDIVVSWHGSQFRIGDLLGSLVDFTIVALVVFIVVRKLLRIEMEEKK